MATITKKEWLKAVKTEAENLKRFASKDELLRLDFETFNPRDEEACIYGQMAGDCSNSRAQNLILKCCEKFTRFDRRIEGGFTKDRDLINGKVQKLNRHDSDTDYYSSIEHYIMMKDAKNKELIEYLRGERKTFNP